MAATSQSPRQSIISSHNQYSTVAKPAALTGNHYYVTPRYYRSVCDSEVTAKITSELQIVQQRK